MISLVGVIRSLAARLLGRGGISADYQLHPARPDAMLGWTASVVASRQHEIFAPLIQQARAGNPRLDFRVAADAVAATHEVNPRVLEIGCGSGYYGEILPRLLGRAISYVGVDYSTAMTALARQMYPATEFVAGDALALPVATSSCDICLSGTSLMHIPDYRNAVKEMVRVSSRWCIFHTVPVMSHRATLVLSKLAYGERVPEIIFNRRMLEGLFAEAGLTIRSVRESFPYDVSPVVGEKTTTLTYLCEKVA